MYFILTAHKKKQQIQDQRQTDLCALDRIITSSFCIKYRPKVVPGEWCQEIIFTVIYHNWLNRVVQCTLVRPEFQIIMEMRLKCSFLLFWILLYFSYILLAGEAEKHVYCHFISVKMSNLSHIKRFLNSKQKNKKRNKVIITTIKLL